MPMKCNIRLVLLQKTEAIRQTVAILQNWAKRIDCSDPQRYVIHIVEDLV